MLLPYSRISLCAGRLRHFKAWRVFVFILATFVDSYFDLTRSGFCLNESGGSYYLTFNSKWDIKTKYMESPGRPDKKYFSKLGDTLSHKGLKHLFPKGCTSTVHLQEFTTQFFPVFPNSVESVNTIG